FPIKAPAGYLNDRNQKKIVIDPSRAPIIRRAFEQYATGNFSLADIRKEMIEAGYTQRNGGRPPKSSIELILKNPFYYGEFRWRGQLYKGNHEPLISRATFDRVQRLLEGKGPGLYQERAFAFGQFLTCAHCGCTITAEIKKEKYIYYRCTNGRGKCPQRYVREEALVEQLGEVMKAIRIDPLVARWIEEAIEETSAEEQAFHDAEVGRLEAEIEKLTLRMEKMYEDKLEGVVSEEFWSKKAAEWQRQKREAEVRLEAMHRADQSFKALAKSTLELAHSAHTLFIQQGAHEQRWLLNHVLSNCFLRDGEVVPEYRKPFELLAYAAKHFDKEKAVSGSSTPETAVKWA
ncbi:MAG: recombinase family protein, partial [Candidatus Sericytochromatia bacterium]